MGKSKSKDKTRSGSRDKGKKAAKAGKVAKLPKKECCVSKSRCGRCPIRMLQEGTLPEGYTVKKRKLVKVKKKAAKELAA